MATLAVVVSRADSASVHIGEHLRELANWETHTDDSRPDAEGGGTVYRIAGTSGGSAGTSGGSAGAGGPSAGVSPPSDGIELREFERLHLDLENVADAFDDPDLLVFASRHSGETGPLLTAHHTGNFGPAEFGGEDGRLARACPNAHRHVIDSLRTYAPPDYEVGMECTHHGPSSVGVPSMFVEVGSGEPQWNDSDAARAVARAILDLREVPPDAPRENGSSDPPRETGSRRHLVGFGGGHYAPRFERVGRETDWAIGHVAADWCLDAMGDPDEARDVLRQAFERSRATRALVDGDYPALEDAIESLGYEVVSETWVRETAGVPLALVDRLETALVPVDEGLRFGADARGVADDDGDDGAGSDGEDGAGSTGSTDPPAEVAVVPIPAELRDAARAIDEVGVREAVEATTLAFETTDSGTTVGDRAAVTDRERYDALVDDLIAILDRDYETVERDGDTVRASERAFDPERARTLGVPEGPKFGQLSAGRAVEVDGERIDPDAVHVNRDHRFPVPDPDASSDGGDRN